MKYEIINLPVADLSAYNLPEEKINKMRSIEAHRKLNALFSFSLNWKSEMYRYLTDWYNRYFAVLSSSLRINGYTPLDVYVCQDQSNDAVMMFQAEGSYTALEICTNLRIHDRQPEIEEDIYMDITRVNRQMSLNKTAKVDVFFTQMMFQFVQDLDLNHATMKFARHIYETLKEIKRIETLYRNRYLYLLDRQTKKRMKKADNCK